jgi:hypothetical protein
MKPRILTSGCQAGIGTYTKSLIKIPVLDDLVKLQDSMFARHLSDHVKGGYLPMPNYFAPYQSF